MAERKRFISVEIPILDKEIQVLGTAKDLHNKTIKMDLSKMLRGKGLNVTFQILNKDDKLFAYPKKLELTKSYIRRIIRTRTDTVEDSFQVNAKDVKVTLKPFLITRKRVSRAVRKNLRNTAKEFLVDYVKTRTYLELCESLLNNIAQKELLPKLKKIYPLAFCDLRIVETKEIEKLKIEQRTPVEVIEESTEEEPEVAEEAEKEIETEEPGKKKSAVQNQVPLEESKKTTKKERDKDADKE